MIKALIISLGIVMSVMSCKSPQPQSQSVGGLRKVYYKDQSEVQRLREAGAEIVVQQRDYVVIRTTKMVSALAADSEPISEGDLIQRLARIYPVKTGELQKVVDTGLDLWEVKADTAIARVYDLQIDRLKDAGFKVEIIAEDASKLNK